MKPIKTTVAGRWSRVGLLTALTLCGQVWLHAQLSSIQVNFSAGIGERPVVDSLGLPVPDGNQVRIGYFTVGFDVGGNAADLDALQDAWHPFGQAEIRTLMHRYPGSFTGSATSTDAEFNGQKIYLWAFKTGDHQAPGAGFGNVQQYGLFSSSLVSWTFPEVGAVPPANLRQISTREVDHAWYGAILAGPSGSPGALQLVPEPASASALAALGLTLVSVLRRPRRAEDGKENACKPSATH
jgi:hypothetical protein